MFFFQHRDKHQEQVAQLRDEITEKATLMEELKDDNQKMTFEFIVITSQLLKGQLFSGCFPSSSPSEWPFP